MRRRHIFWVILLIFVIILGVDVPSGFALVKKQDIEELTISSDRILMGTVKSIISEWNPNRTTINTFVRVSVEKDIKGGPGKEDVTIRVPGGKVGNLELRVSDTPRFKVGERVLLFLQVEDTNIFRLNGWSQGKRTIRKDTLAAENAILSLPQINSISPTSGSAGTGTLLTISGSSFGPYDLWTSNVVFTDEFFYVYAPIISWNDTTIVSEIPYGASSGAVTVENSVGTSNSVNFNVTFSYGGVKWHDSDLPVNYYINQSGTPNDDQEFIAIQNSFQTWEDVSTAYIDFTYSGTTPRTAAVDRDGYNVLSWGLLDSSAIALTYVWFFGDHIVETDVEFNSAYIWSDSGQAGKMDVQNIATHEIGHWLLLEDLYGTADSAKTMYGIGGYGETKKRTLTNDDISGISYIYPASDTIPPTVVSTQPFNGQMKVLASALVKATFSESLEPTTVNTGSFTLYQGATQVAGAVTYDSATKTATFDPTTNLSYGTTYTATIKGGASGVKDLAGNPVASDYSWSFTTNFRPTADSIIPTSGSTLPGIAHSFTTSYSDANGWQDIREARLLFNTSATSTGGVQVRYDQNTNKLYLRNDTNTAWLGGYTPGSTNSDGSDRIIQNSYAQLNVTNSIPVTGSGNSLSVNWSLTFKNAFSGKKYNTYLYVKDDQNVTNGGWQKRGTYTVNYPPIVGTITPASGSAPANTPQLFTATYMDTDGWQMIREAKLLINTTTSGANAIYVYYNQNTNKLYLRNDANTAWLGGYVPGSPNIIENNYGTLNVASTSVSGSGTTLTVNWSITPKTTMSGKTYNTYLYVKDDAYASNGWKKKGTWGVN